MSQLVVSQITVTDGTVRVVTIGTTGTSGYSGYSGKSGYSGYSGKSGYSGANPGASGYSGYSGKSGFSGYSGRSGFSGYSGAGISGFSGYSGTSGFSGYSGKSGFSGYSGLAALVAYQTSDFTESAAALTNTTLSITLVNGQNYSFQVVLFISNTVAADGIQYDFNGGSATASYFIAQGTRLQTGATVPSNTAAAVTALATALSHGLSTTTTTTIIITGLITASSDGTFILRAAEASHSSGTLTVSKGSYMVAQKI